MWPDFPPLHFSHSFEKEIRMGHVGWGLFYVVSPPKPKKVLNETVESILATEWLKTPQQAFSFSQM